MEDHDLEIIAMDFDKKWYSYKTLPRWNPKTKKWMGPLTGLSELYDIQWEGDPKDSLQLREKTRWFWIPQRKIVMKLDRELTEKERHEYSNIGEDPEREQVFVQNRKLGPVRYYLDTIKEVDGPDYKPEMRPMKFFEVVKLKAENPQIVFSLPSGPVVEYFTNLACFHNLSEMKYTLDYGETWNKLPELELKNE